MTNRLLSTSFVRVITFVFLIICIAAVFQWLTPKFLSINNFKGMLRAMSVSGIVALGLTFVIVLRKFDLSLAGLASISAMTLGYVLSETGELAPSIIACISVGLLFGIINGCLVGIARLPDVVMLGMQIPVAILLATALVTGFMLHATSLGQSFYAVGENNTAAWFSGISVAKITTIGFGIAGALVGVAMLIQISGIGSSRVTSGSQILLPAYTSVYLGAALLGRPSILATLVGSLIMTMLLNGFTLLSVPYYYSDAVVSLVLILAIVLFDPQFLANIKRPWSWLTNRTSPAL